MIETFDKDKAENASQKLFVTLIEEQLTEAEAVFALVMTLTMRVAFNCRKVEELEDKLSKAKDYFADYSRVNLANMMAAIISKEQDIPKRAH